MIINNNISIGEEELEFDFVRSSGPGGQNVNKVNTAVQLRFDVVNSPSLPEDVRARLIRLGGSRMTSRGVLVIDARRHRTQTQNREDAVLRLQKMIELAARKPKKRKKTRPSRASVKRRLESKAKKSQKKRLRGRVSSRDY